MANRILAVLFALVVFVVPRLSHASFHLWRIKEIYSNSDGSIQFIEMQVPGAGDDDETLIGGKTIVVTAPGGGSNTFTFNTNLVGATGGKHLLIATPGFARIPGAPTPDFTLPCGPFFDQNSGSLSIVFKNGGTTVDSIVFIPTPMVFPTNGTNSLTDSDLNAGTSLSSGTNSPTNFAGSAGQLALTACQIAGSCEPCDDGLYCTGTESCSGSACIAIGACNEICNEGASTCFECNNPSDCNDSNVCTDDDCVSHNCTHINNTDACGDGLYCNGDELCAGGSCAAGTNPCGTDQCLEAIDDCGDCTLQSDCDDGNECTSEICDGAGACSNPALANGTACSSDGDFCTGVEECSSGVCASPGDPCSGDEICNETGNLCEPLCSNGALDGSEECDDGNTVDDDGCTDCAIDPGYDCMTNVTPSVCGLAPDGGHDHDHDAGVPNGSDGGPLLGNDASTGSDASAAGGTGNGSGNDDDASAPSGNDAGGPGNGMSGGNSSDASTSDAGSGEGAGADSTCNCRLPHSKTNRPVLPLILLGLSLLVRRTSRRSARVG